MSIRRAAVAGQFYPASPTVLRDSVETYIRDSQVSPAPEHVAAIISPHAGYIYSGPTAGFVFARIRGKTPKRVIILGRSHRYYFEKASVFTGDGFETPLGVAPVDKKFAEDLAHETGATTPEAHVLEHAIEVQVPFLQVALEEAPIVPVLFGADPTDWNVRLGETLAEMLEPDDLVVASTDLSHFLSEAEANALDKATLDRILSKDHRALARELLSEECSMCGGAAVVTAMAYATARGANDWRLLDYRTSAAASGDFHRVVGYGAVTMEKAA